MPFQKTSVWLRRGVGTGQLLKTSIRRVGGALVKPRRLLCKAPGVGCFSAFPRTTECLRWNHGSHGNTSSISGTWRACDSYGTTTALGEDRTAAGGGGIAPIRAFLAEPVVLCCSCVRWYGTKIDSGPRASVTRTGIDCRCQMQARSTVDVDMCAASEVAKCEEGTGPVLCDSFRGFEMRRWQFPSVLDLSKGLNAMAP